MELPYSNIVGEQDGVTMAAARFVLELVATTQASPLLEYSRWPISCTDKAKIIRLYDG
jgi:hypothetical protein